MLAVVLLVVPTLGVRYDGRHAGANYWLLLVLTLSNCVASNP